MWPFKKEVRTAKEARDLTRSCVERELESIKEHAENYVKNTVMTSITDAAKCRNESYTANVKYNLEEWKVAVIGDFNDRGFRTEILSDEREALSSITRVVKILIMW